MQLPKINKDAIAFGLVPGPGGAHGNRTIMLAELDLLFSCSDSDATPQALRSLVVDENVLLKQTESNRREVFTRLRVMYSLDPAIPLYRALRSLWSIGVKDRPLLALLVALGRDSLLRATSPIVLDAQVGQLVRARDMEESIETTYPGIYTEIGKGSVTRHAASSWTQSGHLLGRSNKVRSLVDPGAPAATLAILIASICGVRGLNLLDNFWTHALDLSPEKADILAVEAYRKGWIDYRRIGDVLEIGMEPLLKGIV